MAISPGLLLSAVIRRLPAVCLRPLDAWSLRLAQQRAQARRLAARRS